MVFSRLNYEQQQGGDTDMAYKIAKYRKKKGMTQTELAQKSGVSRAILSGLESGRITVTTTETLLKIAKALECSVSDIFFEENV